MPIFGEAAFCVSFRVEWPVLKLHFSSMIYVGTLKHNRIQQEVVRERSSLEISGPDLTITKHSQYLKPPRHAILLACGLSSIDYSTELAPVRWTRRAVVAVGILLKR